MTHETKLTSVDKGLSTGAVTASIVCVALGLLFFVEGLDKIQQHEHLGWFIGGAGIVLFVPHCLRLMRFELSAHRNE
jgi:hypothetical protein